MDISDDSEMAKKKYMDQIAKLLSLNNGDRYELWKYFEDNADKLETTLWDQGKWIMTIQGAVLFLPFTANFIAPIPSFPYLKTGAHLFLIFLICLFGVVISCYSLSFQKNVGKHISRNFDRAICARDGSLCSISTIHKIQILRCTTFTFIFAYILLPLVLILGKLLN